MIRITPQPEPAVFDEKVRKKGQNFLATNSKPTREDFDEHPYWRNVRMEIREAYKHICAYSCHAVHDDTGSHTIDHFKPKVQFPQEAYEWTNLRYVCGLLNSNKGTGQILDPFTIPSETFYIEFPSLEVKVSSEAPSSQVALAKDTIRILKLNDDTGCLKRRWQFVNDYCVHGLPFNLLKRDAPFLAAELERQELVDAIKSMWIDGPP